LPTLLAVARALALLEGEAVARPLEGLYTRLCECALPESRRGEPAEPAGLQSEFLPAPSSCGKRNS
jgi:hypothetical protein